MKVEIKKMDAITAFQSASNLASNLGITSQAISQWGELVPELSARGILILNPKIPHKIKKPKATT